MYYLGEMYITTKMRIELDSQDMLRIENIFGKKVALFTHLQRPTLDRVEFKSIRLKVSLVYHYMKNRKEQTLRD